MTLFMCLRWQVASLLGAIFAAIHAVTWSVHVRAGRMTHRIAGYQQRLTGIHPRESQGLGLTQRERREIDRPTVVHHLRTRSRT